MLSKLPNELMDKIFDYLNQEDQLKLAQVSEHLGSIYAYKAHDKFKKLDCCSFSDDDLRLILRLCGQTVVHLKVLDVLNGPIFDLVSQYCNNLECVTLNFENIDSHETILKLICLRTVKLEFDNILYSQLDAIDYIKPECEELSLDISWNDEDDPDDIAIPFRGLDATGWCWKNIRNVFEKCVVKTLRVLKISHAELLTPRQDLVYPELEELTILRCQVASYPPTCPKLKSLIMNSNLVDRDVDLFNVMKKYAATLERFENLDNRLECVPMSTANFLEALRECKKLKIFCTEKFFVCSLLDYKFDSFMEVLKGNGFNPQRRFHMEIEANIDEQKQLKDMPRYSELSKLVSCHCVTNSEKNIINLRMNI